MLKTSFTAAVRDELTRDRGQDVATIMEKLERKGYKGSKNIVYKERKRLEEDNGHAGIPTVQRPVESSVDVECLIKVRDLCHGHGVAAVTKALEFVASCHRTPE